MPIVELQFLIDQHGAEKVRAELGRLTGATKQAATAAVPLQSQLSKLGSAITGPLGVATGVALATKKLIDFGEAAAHTDKQKAAFEKFNATMGVAERQVGEAVAGLLSMDGVLDTIGTAVGATTEVISAMGGALKTLEPVVWLVSKAVEIAVAPVVAWARAGEWLVETATEIIPGLESTADATDEAARAAERAADKFFGLSEATASVNAQLAAQISLRRAEADADRARKAAAQQDFDTEKDREARLSRAVDLARKGTDSIRRNEDELRASLGDLREEALRSEEALALLAEDAPERTAAQEAYNKANVAYLDVAGAIEGLDAKRARSTAEVRTETEKLTLTLRDIEFALYDVRVAASDLFAPLAEWPDMLAGADALALIQRNVRSVGTVLDRVSDKWSNFNDRLTESREAQEALDAATKKRNDAVWAGVEGGAALVKTVAGNAWVDAVLGAALETAKGIGTIISNPAESVTHFASAAQFLVAQAIAESKGGGSGAVSSAGAAAPAVSSAPKSVLDRNEQQDSETNLAIYVDGRVLGEVAATGINKAGRRGTAVLDRRTQGQRNSRRGLT